MKQTPIIDRLTSFSQRVTAVIQPRMVLVACVFFWIGVAPAVGPGTAVVEPQLGDSASPATCVDGPKPYTNSNRTESAPINGTVTQLNATTYKIEYTLAESGPKDLHIDTGERPIQVLSTSGFARTEGYYRLSEKHNDGAITYRIKPNKYGNRTYKSENSTKWLFGPLPDHDLAGVNLKPAKKGYIGSNFVYLGNYTVASRTVGCHEIRLIIASNASLPTNRTALLNAYEWTARHLDVGHAHDQVRGFVVPGGQTTSQEGGYASPENEFVVFTPNRLHTAWNAWLHEYVHVRQDSQPVGTAAWFTEGSASYLSARAALEQGLTTPREYDRQLSLVYRLPENQSLADSGENPIAYYRGMAVLSRLDAAYVENENVSVMQLLHYTNRNQYLNQQALTVWVQERASNQSVFRFSRSIKTKTYVEPDYLLGPEWLQPRMREAIGLFGSFKVRVIFSGLGLFAVVLGVYESRDNHHSN